MKSDLDSGQQLSSEASPSSLKGCPKGGVVESNYLKGCPKGGVVESNYLKGCPKDGVVESNYLKGCPKDGVVESTSTNVTTSGCFMVNGTPVYKHYTPNFPYNANLKLRARELRKAGVLSEVLFWQVVHQGHFWGIDFDRQRVIGNYVVDFYVKSLSLVVEIDGLSHVGKEEYDRERQSYLESLGLRMFRIEDYRVKSDLDAVMRELEDFIIKEYSAPRPSAL